MLEMAVCLPVVLLILVGTIEACTMLFLQQSLDVAAYEGARVALVPTATESRVIRQCEELLEARGVQDYQVQIAPADVQSVPNGDWLRVQVSAPFGANSMVGGYLFTRRTLTGSVEVMNSK